MIVDKISLAVITGPTGVGKTGLSLRLARRFDAEIISADSVQVYRLLDIGSAKPSAGERREVPHHMIDVADPDEDFDAARYRAMALDRCREIIRRGKRVLVVGGTGLYIKALLKGLFPAPPVSLKVRERLKEEAREAGPAHMHERLAAVDPESAERIHPNDTYRIVRALEVFELTKQPLSHFQNQHRFRTGPFRSIMIGLTIERKTLYERIDERVDQMMRDGFVEEVQRLLRMGYGPDLKSMQSIGYRHLVRYARGETSLEEAVDTLKRDTRRFAKRQYTWFRGQPDLEWFDITKAHEIQERLEEFYETAQPDQAGANLH